MRVGQGFDAHRFTEGNEIILGGIAIPCKQGIEAHSDGDVLLHAICDALLGAAGLGDIGRHYPDEDNKNLNRNSREFIIDTVKKLADKNFSVMNVDATIILQQPRISQYIDDMCQLIAQDLNVETDAVNIKATTTEKMGFVGREEGVAAMAVVLLQ